MQKAGDKVRVNVQLIDARADTHLWAKSYDRDLRDVLAVESEVSQEIAEALQANLSPSESHVLASARTHDTEAYDLFLRGEYEFHQAQSSFAADALDRADAFYRQALARDPNFAMATAGLAYARLFRHWFVAPLTPRELGEVKSIIDRAAIFVLRCANIVRKVSDFANKTFGSPAIYLCDRRERATGIEPAWPAWKAGTLPLSYARV